MKQKLLTDIELDVHELRYLADSFTKEPTPTLSELLKRSIARMQERLNELQQEVDAVQVISPSGKEESKPVVLGESLKLAAGLREAISLNDSFRFSRELFGGDTDLMNRVIEQISVMSSYKTAIAFLSSKVELDEEKEAVNDFLELLKNYFNQSA